MAAIETKPKPDGLVKYEAKIEAKRAAKIAGRLYRVKHLAYGQMEVEAESEAEAIGKFAERFAPTESKNQEWLKRFARECRVAKIRPVEAA